MKMKEMIKRLKQGSYFFSLLLAASSVLAGLPTPPEADMADSNSDWITVGGKLLDNALTIACVVMGAAILLGAAAGIIGAYQTAHKTGELSHFFKMLVIGLVAAAIGLALVYVGYTIVHTTP